MRLDQPAYISTSASPLSFECQTIRTDSATLATLAILVTVPKRLLRKVPNVCHHVTKALDEHEVGAKLGAEPEPGRSGQIRDLSVAQ